MPAPIYEATSYNPANYGGTRTVKDYADEADARAAVKNKGGGSVVKFAQRYNSPGALPEIVASSIWMDVYENGAWRNANIHTA